MKKLLIILLTIATIGSAYAMPPRGGFHGGGSRTTVILGGGFYNPYYYPFGFYGYPYYPYGIPTPPSKLDLQIQGIKTDYSDKIKSVKMDDTLTKEERKEKVREFKTERSEAIIQAKQDYYKQ